MPPVKIEDTLIYYGLNRNVLSGQSILDVFVLQDIVSPEDAASLRKNLRTNREIENFLLQNGIVSKETINKAYSILLKIPFVSLRNVQVEKEVLNLIPYKMAVKFGVVAFSNIDNVIRIALSRPADLLLGFENGLAKVLEANGHEVELFITGEEDYGSILSQYDNKNKQALRLSRGAYPVVYLRNQIIPEKFLKRLPRDIIEKNRVVVFDENKTGHFFLAAEKPDSPVTLKLLSFLERENHIKLELFATSRDDIDFALELYDGKKPEFSQDTEAALSVETQTAEPAPVVLEQQKPKVVANNPKNGLFSFSNFWVSEPKSNQPEDDFTIDSVVPDVAKNNAANSASQPNNLSSPAKVEVGTAVNNAVGQVEPSKTTNIKIDDQEQPQSPSPQVPEKAGIDDSLEDKDLGQLISGDIIEPQALEGIVAEGYIPKIVAAIINYALNNRASDIHVEPENKILRVRCRIDGILRDVAKMPLSLHPPFISRIKILSKLKIDESRIPQDGRFDITFERREVDVRVSTLPTVHGEKIVMRILDKSQGILSLEDLGMQGSAFDLTIQAISRPHGIILSTGPTGSGKSTTLYAIMNRISVPGINIVTLEDPVEYEIPGVNQCQVKPDIGFTFASGLRSVLRQDPNVIMVGEIRDSETANMATHAALTGHLVLSTLHTNDAAGSLPRLTNMGVEPFLITSSVNLIIAQRLVRRICPKCREEMKVPQKLYDEIIAEVNKISPKNTRDRSRLPSELKLYYGRGCKDCNQGYKGRVGLFEVLEMTPEIEDLAVARKTANDIKQAAINSGMITMKQDGIIKAFLGLTTVDEVFQAVVSS